MDSFWFYFSSIFKWKYPGVTFLVHETKENPRPDYCGKKITSCWQTCVLSRIELTTLQFKIQHSNHWATWTLWQIHWCSFSDTFGMFLLCSKMWYSSKNKQNSYKEFFLIIILIGWVNPITSDDQLWNLSQLPTLSVSVLPPASCRFQGCHGYMCFTCSSCTMWIHQPHRPLSHVHLFATIRLPATFMFPIMQFVFPTKFCTGNGFSFSWD